MMISMLRILPFLSGALCFSSIGPQSRAFRRTATPSAITRDSIVRGDAASSTALNFFDKIFEEEGMLGKGITVGKIQVALMVPDRSDTSIFAALEDEAAHGGNSPEELSEFANEICLALMRRSDSWTAAASVGKWFSENDAGKAESYYNELANAEAVKFEKEYIPGADSKEKTGGSTLAVVSLVVEIQGDSTTFEGAGFSFAKTKEVLASIASDTMVDDGYCVNAVEAFWTPGDGKEVLTRSDIIADFPELIDL
eukprot:CAMPEP_0198118294 /NCGR_PEP_ID=MMETSP1442-20131203/21058_1 /TAXON_ID= /ORGANISM="Craspedostauros australis, Strain CCMP3328" /LENGTH=253 /DNA_ID=CAMNT_0043776521 /DNA_START=11 /DNA_END=772 /DNA_ORIENTATION=+